MITEADTCRKYVLPKLYGADWRSATVARSRTTNIKQPISNSPGIESSKPSDSAEHHGLLEKDRPLRQDNRILRRPVVSWVVISDIGSPTIPDEADLFDLLCPLASNAPLRMRRERADRVKKTEKTFFDKYGPKARSILADLWKNTPSMELHSS